MVRIQHPLSNMLFSQTAIWFVSSNQAVLVENTYGFEGLECMTICLGDILTWSGCKGEKLYDQGLQTVLERTQGVRLQLA